MSFFFQKPENALKRAKELIAIPGMDANAIKRAKRSALEILHDALIAKKNRTWQPAHEELMIAYLDICIELQLGRIGKDGLHQYRNLSIQHNPASLETVIQHFVSQTEQKLALAKRESNDLILLAAAKVDLEAAQTPEAVMLSTTTFEGSSDRTDREVVVPWLRFTWETYRTVLDILKNNTKLEGLYKSIAMKAFDFCTEYTRKIEFRRLCEILRNHLGSLQKHTAAPTSQSSRLLRSWDGFTLEGVESLLEIRYRQLQVATELELFSEAFRTIDDINTIMSLVDQVPRLELMVTYYEKLAQIFLVSKNHLFHAFALYKWYGLRVAGLEGINGGAVLATLPSLVTPEEQQEIATRVVLAALSIPLLEFESASPVLDADSTPSAVNSAENSLSVAAREKNVRMASLLGFTSTPTRAILLDEIEAAGVIKKAVPEVSSLYRHLEREEVDPLQIVTLVQPHLEKIRELSNSYKNQTQESSYAHSVERLLVRRVLFQLTRVYSSVTIAHLRSLFVGLNVSYQEIEQLIVRSRSLSTVAHTSAPSLSAMYLKNQSNSNSNNHSNNVEASTSSATATATRTKIRIDHVQQIIRFSEAVELEANPAQLTLLGERLERVLKKVQYTKATEAVEASRKKLFQAARNNLNATRSDMLERREIIERKKEELERLQQEKAKTMEKKRQEYEQMRQQVERERLEQEARRREAEKKQKIKDEIALKETKQMLEKLGHMDHENFDLENLDREKLMNDAKEKAQKVKEDAQRKLRDSARRLDYIIRATREVEQPILQKQFTQAKEDAKLIYEQDKEEKLKAAKEAYEFGLKEKARLATVFTVHSEFVEAHYARRRELYKKAAEEHKKKALLERLEKRVAHAKERYDEEQERLREEEEERERLRREEEEEIERQRQAEIDEELRRQEEEEEETRRVEEEEKELELAAQREREHEEEKEREASRSAYRPPVARRSERSERDEGEWTQVSRPTARAAAPEGQWDRRGPAARDDRDAPRGPLRSGSGMSRFGDREPREGGSRFGDREPREGGSRFGDREPREGSSRFGDRDAPREGGLRRGLSGDREERPAREDGPSSAWRRGGERESAPREGGDDRFFGGRSGGESYRPPRGDAADKRPARESTRAPDSGRWR
ncbi:hypothetical protein Gpo141_00008751 [Globisporangium polare]